ncbi:MAG: hypothetical protein AB7E61_07075 [Acholeplasmataceae bacterium]
MELKRYVRVKDNYGALILDVVAMYEACEHKDVWKSKERLFRFGYGDCEIIATADTILELAQVGDMVEVELNGKLNYFGIITKINDEFIFYDNEFKARKDQYSKINNLWVRQDNDTFKRYEVK